MGVAVDIYKANAEEVETGRPLSFNLVNLGAADIARVSVPNTKEKSN